MKGRRKKRSSRPADSQAAREAPAPADSLITVRCPSPGCGKTYTIPGSSIGKNARCTCGAVFPVAPPSPARPADRPAPAAREERAAPEGEGVTEVRVGCIGRGHAGKTALLRALSEGPVGDFFPSGLHVDAGDPREVAQMIRESEEANRLLHECGLPPTLEASQVRYFLYEGDEQRIAYKMREVIGQVLTHTLPSSAADQQAPYAQYIRSLVDTHVLWAVVPCQPPNPSASDRRRYANDLRITLAYLREALRLRQRPQPVAVALVLSKIDTLFADTEEARASLTDEVLAASFGPLVHLIEQSPRVSDAVVIPVTVFGFGNAVLRKEGGRVMTSDTDDDPFASEPIWLLREGRPAQPYNLDTLFLWTLLYGLVNQAAEGDEEAALAHICRTLWDDLGAMGPWLLTLKEGTAELDRLALQAQGAASRARRG